MIDFEQKGQKCTFTLTSDFFDFLVSKDIFFGANERAKNRVRTRFHFFDPVAMGPFSSHVVGNVISNIGGFSYTRSPMVHGMKIGNYCSIADKVSSMGVNHPFTRFSSSSFTYDTVNPKFTTCAPDIEGRFQPQKNTSAGRPPAIIEHDVWIGGSVILANNITIGTGAIIAAGSVVTKDVAPFDIVGGNPARVIRKRFPDEVCQRLLALDWYSYQFPYFSGVDVNQEIDTQIDQLEAVILSGAVPKIPESTPFIDLVFAYLGEKPTA